MFNKSEVEVILSALSFHESACEMMKKVNRPSDSYDYWSSRLSQNKAIVRKLRQENCKHGFIKGICRQCVSEKYESQKVNA